MAVGRDLQKRNASVWILGEEFGRATFALQNVDLDELVRNAEPGQRQADLVAIAGPLHRIERVHLSSKSRTIFSWRIGRQSQAIAWPLAERIVFRTSQT